MLLKSTNAAQLWESDKDAREETVIIDFGELVTISGLKLSTTTVLTVSVDYSNDNDEFSHKEVVVQRPAGKNARCISDYSTRNRNVPNGGNRDGSST